jgi:hypothetical protein
MPSTADVLQRCLNGCCYFVNREPVTEARYLEALDRVPSMMAGVEAGKRAMVLESFIECRRRPIL